MGILISPLEWIRRFNFGLYLESGFLNLISTGQCTEGAYLPASLHYDPATAAYISSTNTPLQGQVSKNVLFNQSLSAVHNVEVATSEQINTAEYIEVTNTAGTTGYAINTDYTATINGITALSTGSIADGQQLLVDYTKVVTVTPDETPFNGQPLIDGYESRAVGCDSKSLTITDPCGNTYSSGGYCSASLQPKKDTQKIVPSSMFTGKLRLYVQALYGSLRDDYVRSGFNLKINADSTDENYPEYTLNRGFTENSWLYTAANYDYFLCRFIGAQIQFIKLELSAEGGRFRDILKNHARKNEASFATKLEAYILSTARVTNIGYTVNITGDPILGSPLDYGWHAIWDGHKANVVCFYDDPDAPQYLSNQYELNITESWDGINYTFTVANTTLIADAGWWPFTNGLNLFYYDEILQSMIPVEYPNVLFGGYTGHFNAPIYNRYKRDAITGIENLDTVNIYFNKDDPVDSTFILANGTIMPVGDFTARDVKRGVSSGNKGFSISQQYNVPLSSVVDYDERVEWRLETGEYERSWAFSLNSWGASLTHPLAEDWAAANGVTIGQTADKPWVNPDTGATETVTGTVMWRSTWVRYIYYAYNDSGSSESGSSFFEVMLGDASNFVMGVEKSSVSDFGTSSSLSGYIVTQYRGTLEWVYDLEFWGKPTLEVIAGAPADMGVLYNSFTSGDGSYSDPGSDNVDPHDTQEFILTTDRTDGVTAELSGATTGNAEYFHPTVSDKPTHTTDTARQSISGLNKINHADFTKDGGYLHDSSVGWQ